LVTGSRPSKGLEKPTAKKKIEVRGHLTVAEKGDKIKMSDL